jgi:hypothetical protein
VNHHIDKRRIIFDGHLLKKLSDATEPPNANGCMFYSEHEGQGRHIEVTLVDGPPTIISVLRVAFYFAGRGHTGHDQEIGHVCGNKGAATGTRLCVAPDHLERISKAEKIRRLHRGGFIARMRKVLPDYGQQP